MGVFARLYVVRYTTFSSCTKVKSISSDYKRATRHRHVLCSDELPVDSNVHTSLCIYVHMLYVVYLVLFSFCNKVCLHLQLYPPPDKYIYYTDEVHRIFSVIKLT